MSRKRRYGMALTALGILLIGIAAVVASAASATATAESIDPAAPPARLGLGWILGLAGVVLSFAGVVMTANARGAFF